MVATEAKRLKMEDKADCTMAEIIREVLLDPDQVHITLIPDDLKSRIAQFLGAKDALSFASSCKSLHESLSFSCLQPSILYENMVAWSGDPRNGDTPRKYRRIPILFASRVHSVVVTLHWRDQGWGNCKGQIYVVAVRGDDKPTVSTTPVTAATQEVTSDDPFQGGRLVYESPVAQHTEERLRFDFSPRPEETYYLWSKMGGGGGHMLSLRNFRIQVLLQADFGQHVRRNYTAIQEQANLEFTAPRPLVDPDAVTGPRPPLGVSSFYFNLLLQVARSLLTQLEDKAPVDKGLSTYLSSHGIEVSVDSLTALIEIITTILDEHTRRTEEQEAFMEQVRRHREQLQQRQQHLEQQQQRQQEVHIQINVPELMQRAQHALLGHLPGFLQGAEEALGLAEEAFGQVGETFARAEMNLNLAQDAVERQQQARNDNNNNNYNDGNGNGNDNDINNGNNNQEGEHVHHEAFVIPIMGNFGEGVFMQPNLPFFFHAGVAQNQNNNDNDDRD